MINPKDFVEALNKEGISNFSGVPDSLLKNVCAYISDNSSKEEHLITPNEGSAIALAVGQYIASGKPSLVYMQNSGFGNAVNPLLSLADKMVYGIPMIVLVGWRGEPGIKDEPQHIKQGAVMESMISSCGLDYRILNKDDVNLSTTIKEVVRLSINKKSPIILLVKKDTFSNYALINKLPDISDFTREDAIKNIVKSSDNKDIFVSTTGMPSRELFEIRVINNQKHDQDFLTVGSMGHANMIALGIAQSKISRHIICIDGDGSSLMHLGNLSAVGLSGCQNFIHIVLNNAAHDSVGGQPTCANLINLPAIASACGYKSSFSLDRLEYIEKTIRDLRGSPGPHFLEIKVKKGSRADLGRPTSSPAKNKAALMQNLES